MSFKSQFTGTQIDQAISKILAANIVENGWIKLISTSTEKTDLNKLTNPGNYITNFYINGPLTLDASPINISVYTLNGKTIQVINSIDQAFTREIIAGSTPLSSDWAAMQISGLVFASDTAPLSPVNGKTMWLDISPTVPLLKIYVDGAWVESSPSTAMKKSVYDPNNINRDIYQYIDEEIASSGVGEIAIDFDAHINDASKHLDETEAAKIASAVDPSYIDNKVIALRTALGTDIQAEVDANMGQINTVSVQITQFTNALSTHTANTTVHPSAEKQLEWDEKSPSNHTHLNDGRVTVLAEKVSGVFSWDKLPYDVKERVYVVSDMTALLAITLNPVHNGDCVVVDNGTIQRWFYVIDQTKLGTIDAFIEMNVDGRVEWINVLNKPTTINGYGIGDALLKTDVTNLQNTIAQLDEQLPNAINIQEVQTLVTKIDALDTKLEAYNKVYSNVDSLIIKLKEICTL